MVYPKGNSAEVNPNGDKDWYNLRLFNKKERISGMRVFPQGFLVFPFRSVSLYLRYFDVAWQAEDVFVAADTKHWDYYSYSWTTHYEFSLCCPFVLLGCRNERKCYNSEGLEKKEEKEEKNLWSMLDGREVYFIYLI